jgi:hypothetical protein
MSQQDGAYTNIDDFEQFFRDCGEKYVYWTAYRADGKTILLRNESTEDKNESWELLKRTLVKNSNYGGKFPMHITNAAKGAGGFQPLVILPPQNTGQAQQNGGSQINGLPLGIGNLDEYTRNLKEKWDLEARLKELENKKEDKMPAFVGAIMNHPTFNATTFANNSFNFGHRLLGMMERAGGFNMPSPTAIGIGGYDPTAQAATDETKNRTHHEIKEDGDGEEEVIYDGDKLADVCDTIAEIDNSESPVTFLLAMSDYLKENPSMMQMIKGQIQPYIQKRQAHEQQ